MGAPFPGVGTLGWELLGGAETPLSLGGRGGGELCSAPSLAVLNCRVQVRDQPLAALPLPSSARLFFVSPDLTRCDQLDFTWCFVSIVS